MRTTQVSLGGVIMKHSKNEFLYQQENRMGYDEISSRANAMMQERAKQDIDHRLKFAEKMYNKNQHDAKALWVLYHYYDKGYGGVTVDKQKAMLYLRLAADEGHAGACYELSRKLLFNDDDKSAEEVKFYTGKQSVKKCISKSAIFDEPSYRQQDYIDELENLQRAAEFKKEGTKLRYTPY